MIKINPLCEGCRNFSFQATKVGFPCAMNPKGPDKEGCPDFEAIAPPTSEEWSINTHSPSAIAFDASGRQEPRVVWSDVCEEIGIAELRDDLGNTGAFSIADLRSIPMSPSQYPTVDAIRRAIAAIPSPIVNMNYEVNSPFVRLTDERGQTEVFRNLEVVKLPKHVSEYASIQEVRDAIASLTQTQVTGIDRGSADGSYPNISTVQRCSMHFSATIRPDSEPGSIELTDSLGNTGVFMYSDLQKVERENPGDYHTIADLRTAMTPRPIIGYTSIPLRDHFGNYTAIPLRDRLGIPDGRVSMSSLVIDASKPCEPQWNSQIEQATEALRRDRHRQSPPYGDRLPMRAAHDDSPSLTGIFFKGLRDRLSILLSKLRGKK